jgi:HrpA-like RNA helicase
LVPIPFYSELSEQEKVYALQSANPNIRKVIVASDHAENIIFDGVVFVVDSGYRRVILILIKCFAVEPNSFLEKSVTVPICKSSAIQRASRAGKFKPGKCFRLYTEKEYDLFKSCDVYEIQRRDISLNILQLLALGIENVVQFEYLTQPSEEIFKHAFEVIFV